MYVALSDIHRGFAAAWATACLLSALVVGRHLVRGVDFLVLTLSLGAATQTAQLAWLVMDSWLIEALLAAFVAAVLAFRHRRRLPAWTMVLPAVIAVLVAALLVPWPWTDSTPDLVSFGFSPVPAQELTHRDRVRIVVTVVLAAGPLLALLVGAWPRRRRGPAPTGFGVVDLRRFDP